MQWFVSSIQSIYRELNLFNLYSYYTNNNKYAKYNAYKYYFILFYKWIYEFPSKFLDTRFYSLQFNGIEEIFNQQFADIWHVAISNSKSDVRKTVERIHMKGKFTLMFLQTLVFNISHEREDPLMRMKLPRQIRTIVFIKLANQPKVHNFWRNSSLKMN